MLFKLPPIEIPDEFAHVDIMDFYARKKGWTEKVVVTKYKKGLQKVRNDAGEYVEEEIEIPYSEEIDNPISIEDYAKQKFNEAYRSWFIEALSESKREVKMAEANIEAEAIRAIFNKE